MSKQLLLRNNNNNNNNNNDVDDYYCRKMDPDRYVLIKTPGFYVSHPIYGYLIADGRIEALHIYNLIIRRRQQPTITTTTTTSIASTSCRNDGDNDNDDDDAPICVCFIRLGRNLDGHPGIVHGGMLALLIDEVLGLGCEALAGLQAMAFTANLTIDYRNSCPSNSWIRMAVSLVEGKGRKLFLTCRVENLDQSILYCEAKSLFLLPKGTNAEAIIFDSDGKTTGGPIMTTNSLLSKL